MQEAALIQPADAAAAGADRVDVRHRHRDQVAIDLSFPRQLHLAVLDDRDVETRSAHVHDDTIGLAARPRVRETGHRPAGRTREHRRHREPRDDLGRRDAAVRLHDEENSRELRRSQPAHKAFDVTP
jgi:hypothetical protein